MHEAMKASPRMPVAFIPHGGGPWPWVDMPFGSKPELDSLRGYLESVAKLPPSPPKALLVVSAHWEEKVPTVMNGKQPPMYYDYYGFPPESYRITWPAPGDPALASRVRELLKKGGFESGVDDARGFDHGTFVPLKLTYPNADIPTVQLSLKIGLDPQEHLLLGRAIAPLRDEGVFIVGSGMSFHNMRGFNASGIAASEAFDEWLVQTATAAPEIRDRGLAKWAAAPSARLAHPREEHLLPLMVIAGAAGADKGTNAYSGSINGVRISAYHYGASAV